VKIVADYSDEQITREIESRIDIIDLIAETVDLHRKGNRYWGLCPFHQEKTPSFSVSRDRQMFYCFGCHAGGSIFSFIMKRDGLDFKEAREMLAAKAGVELNKSYDKKRVDLRKQILAVNRMADEYFHQMLLSSKGLEAREYLLQRGINRESIINFHLGYAPSEWNGLEEYLLKKGISQDWVKLSGLIKRNENQNRFYDVFRDRIIFPIYQYNREIVGFGGRVLGEGLPKYLNSPESEVFSKRRNLYGLAQARDNIRNQNEAIIVEGYMDTIKLHQAGICQAVASLGTALTQEQAQILKRYVEKVVILYDGDEAGQRESLRAIEVLLSQGLKVEVVSLPAGQDPDEYLEKNGKEEFWQYIQNNRISHIEFKMNRYINSVNIYNLEFKINIINQLKNDINRLSSALEKDYYIKTLAQKLRLEENLVQQELAAGSEKTSPRPNRNKIINFRDNNKYGKYGIQEQILAAMLSSPEIFTRVKNRIGLNFFANQEYRTIAGIYDQLLQEETDDCMGEMRQIMMHEGLDTAYARISLIMEQEDPKSLRDVDDFIRGWK
jgi:DNA primase